MRLRLTPSWHEVKKLHVGLVGPVPPPNGGMAMQTEQLARLLGSEGVTVTLVPVNPVYRPAFVANIPGVRALFRLVPFLFSIWRLAPRVDVIHLLANSGWSWQLFAAPVLWLAAIRGTPVVVNYRGGEAGEYFSRSFRWVKPSLGKAALIAVPSGFLQEVFREFGQESRIVPNIVDRTLFRPPTGQSRAKTTLDLVVTRNLEAIYGIDTAIKALARVRSDGYPARLFVAGSGPAESSLKALAVSLGVAEFVQFVGRLDRAGIVSLYARADAMLNPANVDNMPNSILEALACGVPVVSTRIGGVPYIIEHEETGLLVPPGDPDAMAAAVIRLSGDIGLRARLRRNGLAEVEQYTWSQVRQEWFSVYRDAMEAREKQVV